MYKVQSNLFLSALSQYQLSLISLPTVSSSITISGAVPELSQNFVHSAQVLRGGGENIICDYMGG